MKGRNEEKVNSVGVIMLEQIQFVITISRIERGETHTKKDNSSLVGLYISFLRAVLKNGHRFLVTCQGRRVQVLTQTGGLRCAGRPLAVTAVTSVPLMLQLCFPCWRRLDKAQKRGVGGLEEEESRFLYNMCVTHHVTCAAHLRHCVHSILKYGYRSRRRVRVGDVTEQAPKTL